jgi:hypothetical protein
VNRGVKTCAIGRGTAVALRSAIPMPFSEKHRHAHLAIASCGLLATVAARFSGKNC